MFSWQTLYSFIKLSLTDFPGAKSTELQKRTRRPSIAFASLEKTALQLDTLVSGKNGAIAVDVYRKPTHTDRCLDYNSHHDSNHKASTATTLLHRNSMIYSYLPKGKSGNLVETMQLWSPTIIHLNLFRTY